MARPKKKILLLPKNDDAVHTVQFQDLQNKMLFLLNFITHQKIFFKTLFNVFVPTVITNKIIF